MFVEHLFQGATSDVTKFPFFFAKASPPLVFRLKESFPKPVEHMDCTQATSTCRFLAE